MKKLSQILETINEVDSLLEIDFKDKKAFQKYNAKHKMRPSTKVNIAGKDTTVGDETGEKKVSKAPETPTYVNDDGDVVANDFESGLELAQNLGMSQEELDYIEKEKDVEALGDYLDGHGYSQKEPDKPKTGTVLPKNLRKKKTVHLDFQMANEKEVKEFAKKYNLEVGKITKNPNGGLQADFVGKEDDLRTAVTSDDYGMDPDDVDSYFDEFGKDWDDEKDGPVNPDVKIDRDTFESAFDRAMDGENYQDAEEFLDIVSNMENQGKFDNLSQDEKLKLEDSMWDLEVGGADLDDDRVIEIRDFFFELQKKHNLFENTINPMELAQLSKISTRYGSIGTDKKLVVESFSSGKLRALANDFRGLDSSFFMWGTKLGVEWDKITDQEIKTNTKPVKKGIEIAYVDKDVTVPVKGKKSYWSSDNFTISKFTAVLVLKDGKPMWYTRGWKRVSNAMTATGKKTRSSGWGGRQLPDVTAGPRTNYSSRDKTFGINQLGYQSLSSVMKIPGIKFHHISLEEDMPYMGAGVKRQMRQAAQFGASKFTTNDEFKRINQQYFDELLKQRLNDPKKLAAKVKRAGKYCEELIDAALGGKKPSPKIQKIIDMVSGKSASQEGDAYRFVSDVSSKLAKLYDYYGYYLSALEKQKEDEKKYGKDSYAFSTGDAEGYAKDVNNYYNYIMTNKFRY